MLDRHVPTGAQKGQMGAFSREKALNFGFIYKDYKSCWKEGGRLSPWLRPTSGYVFYCRCVGAAYEMCHTP